MGPAVVIEIVASPAPGPELSSALVDSCSGAAPEGGCALDRGDGPRPAGRARVVVMFSSGYLSCAVRSPLAARTVHFRSDDPLEQRFRAAGLVVAGLVFETKAASPVEQGRPATSRADVDERSDPGGEPIVPEPAPLTPLHAPPAAAHPSSVLRLSGFGVVAVGGLEPRAGVGLAAAVGMGASPAFVVLSASYEQTLRNSAAGLGEQSEHVGAGAGLRFHLANALALAVPMTVEAEFLRVSLQQPMAGAEDAGSRLRVGCGLAGELAYAVDGKVEVYAGVRAAIFDEGTLVRVHGRVQTELPAWEARWTLGLSLPLP